MPVEMSRAPVGSSQRRTEGRLAMARAIATRCCSPPESCAGKVVQPSLELDEAKCVLRCHGIRGDLGDQGDVFDGGEAGDQVVELEDEADVLAAVGGQRAFVGLRQIGVAIEDAAARRDVEAADDVEERRLAGAGWPEQHDELSLVERERHLSQRVDLHLAHAVDLREVANVKQRRGHLCPRVRRLPCACPVEAAGTLL